MEEPLLVHDLQRAGEDGERLEQQRERHRAGATCAAGGLVNFRRRAIAVSVRPGERVGRSNESEARGGDRQDGDARA